MRVTIKIKTPITRSLNKAVRASIAKTSALITKTWQDSVRRTQGVSQRAKNRYVSAIVPYATRPGAYLADPIAQLLEDGWKAFDMRPGILKGAAKRVIPLQLGDGTQSFRTMTDKGDAASWHHPGYKGFKAISRAKKRLERLLGQAFD